MYNFIMIKSSFGSKIMLHSYFYEKYLQSYAGRRVNSQSSDVIALRIVASVTLFVELVCE